MKDRVTYASQALFIGPSKTGAVGHDMITGLTPTQLKRVQGVSSEIQPNDTYVYQVGSINSVGRATPLSPTINLDIEYVLGDAQNEKWAGLSLGDLTVPAISGLLSGSKDNQNIYLINTKKGDAIKSQSNKEFLKEQHINVMGFGNCSLQDYRVEAAVGGIPTATLGFTASNGSVTSGVSGIPNPAINSSGYEEKGYGSVSIPAPTESDLTVDNLRPSEIVLTFGNEKLKQGGVALPGNSKHRSMSVCSIDSFSINLPINRRVKKRLGSNYPISNKIIGPNEIVFTCQAKSKDLLSGNLINTICEDKRDIAIFLNNPHRDIGNMAYSIKGASLQNQVTDSTLMQNEEVELTFTAPIGGASVNGTGFYMSGISQGIQETTYGITESQLILGEYSKR